MPRSSRPKAEPLSEPLLLIESMDSGLRVRAGCGRCVAFTNPHRAGAGRTRTRPHWCRSAPTAWCWWSPTASVVGRQDEASSLAVQTLSESVTAATETNAPVREAVLDGFERANEQSARVVAARLPPWRR